MQSFNLEHLLYTLSGIFILQGHPDIQKQKGAIVQIFICNVISYFTPCHCKRKAEQSLFAGLGVGGHFHLYALKTASGHLVLTAAADRYREHLQKTYQITKGQKPDV